MIGGQPPQKVKQLLLLQCSLVVILTLVLWLFGNIFYAYSAFLGGAICILPTWVFATILFRSSGAHSAKRILKNFYWGEAVKLLSSIALFALVFSTMTISAGAFFSAFVLVQLSYFLGPIVLRM